MDFQPSEGAILDYFFYTPTRAFFHQYENKGSQQITLLDAPHGVNVSIGKTLTRMEKKVDEIRFKF